MIYDTLLLSELEVISNIDDLNSTTKVSTIDSIVRKELNLNDIGELLASFTPVFVKSYGKGALSTVTFRGTGASHTKVLWEGFNINSPMLGQTDFSLLPGSFFDEIELLYGGASLTDVSGALGGSINLNSNGIHKNSTLNIQQSIGNFNTYLTSASINVNSSNYYSSTRFIRQSSLNNFTYFNNAILPAGEDMTQTNAKYNNIGFTQQLSYRISDKQEIYFITWNQWNSRNIPEIMTNVEKGGNQQEWQHDFFSRNILVWKLHNAKTSWGIKGAYFYEELDYYLQTSDSLENTISLIDSRNKVENYSVISNVSSELGGNMILKVGVEFLYQQVNSNNYIDKKKRTLFNTHVSIKKSFSNILTAEALVRTEITNNGTVPIMPVLGFNYKPFGNQDLHIRVNFSQNYNLPTLNDLYWYPGGNEDLQPERSMEAELGIGYTTMFNRKHRITFSGSAYASSISNWIIWMPGDYRYWSPENIASVYARGIESSLNISGKLGNIEYKVFGEYAYTRTTNNSDSAKMSELSDVQLMYVPVHTANGYVNVSSNGYYATWTLSYISSRNTSLNSDEHYSNKLPQYMLNNISVGKIFLLKKAQFDIRAKIYNIFDVDYQAILWRAMPGRNYELSLSIKI